MQHISHPTKAALISLARKVSYKEKAFKILLDEGIITPDEFQRERFTHIQKIIYIRGMQRACKE